MSQCAAQVFTDITRDRWTALQNKAAQNNIDLSADSGQSTQQGFTFSWQYVAETATLALTPLGPNPTRLGTKRRPPFHNKHHAGP